ncbi:hypothetical protein T492DRAFT_898937 [Pavlovales sp. CCMP2436]|nr:hypothetical protein T492DRAFT_898937 [Pavlovales sp. CCMP2436]
MSASRELLGVDEARVPRLLVEPQRPRMSAPARSSLLDRVATFMPQLEASNAQMQQNEPVILQEDELEDGAERGGQSEPGDVEMDIYYGTMATPAAVDGAVSEGARLAPAA